MSQLFPVFHFSLTNLSKTKPAILTRLFFNSMSAFAGSDDRSAIILFSTSNKYRSIRCKANKIIMGFLHPSSLESQQAFFHMSLESLHFF
jgi:hypothetical protein